MMHPSGGDNLLASWTMHRSSSIGKSSSFRRSWSFQSAGSYSPDRSTQTSDIRKASKAKPPSFRRLLALNKPEWKAAIWGVLGAIGFGVVQPLFAFTLGSMVSAFYEQDHDEMRQQIRKYACIFAGLSMTCFVVNHMRDYNFATMGENLTKRVRERMLGNILTFEVGWFDEDQNSSSVVCSKLASEAAVVSFLDITNDFLTITEILVVIFLNQLLNCSTNGETNMVNFIRPLRID